MTRKVLPPMVLILLGAIALFYWQGTMDTLENGNQENPEQSPYRETPPIDCPSVCRKISECGLPRSLNDCESQCVLWFTEEHRRCIMETSCEFLTDECPDPSQGDCQAACRKLEDCEIMGLEECGEACYRFEKDAFGCIEVNDCEGIRSECFPEFQEERCGLFCDRMTQCGFWDETGSWECMDLCRGENPDVVECVIDSPCRSMTSWCFGSNPEPRCGAYCDKLVLCQELDTVSFDACMEGCSFESPALLDCVLEAECNSLNECYEAEFQYVNCNACCEKLIDCGQWEVETFEECMAECQWESPDLIECILEYDCEEMDVCYEMEKLECIPFCNRLIDCRELDVEGIDACLEGCQEEPFERIECVLTTECEGLPLCFESAPFPPRCSGFCEKLEACGRILPEQFDECLGLCAQDPLPIIECVIETPCHRIDGCYGP